MTNVDKYAIEFLIHSNMSAFAKQAVIASKATVLLASDLAALKKSSDLLVRQGAVSAFDQFTNTLRQNRYEVQRGISASSGYQQLQKQIESNTLSVVKAKTELSQYNDMATRTTSTISRMGEEFVRQHQSTIMNPRYDHTTGQVRGDRIIQPRADMTDTKMTVSSMPGVVGAEAIAARHSLNAAQIAQKQLYQQTINSGKNIQWAGRQITVGLSLPVAAFGTIASKTFLDVDQELVRLTKVYGDVALAGKELENQNNEVRRTGIELGKDMARQYGQDAKDTITLAADIAATGATGQDLKEKTIETTRLMVLGEVNQQDAMRTTLTLQNAFKISSNELKDSINFLNAVENQTSLSLQDMTQAMPRAGTVVKSLGGDVKDLTKFMVAFKVGGISSAEGANSLKTILTSIIAPKRAAKDAFKIFGIDLEKVVEENKGNIMATVEALRNEIQNNIPEVDQAKVYTALFGKWQVAKGMALFNNLNSDQAKTVERISSMTNDERSNIAQTEIDAQMKSISGRWKILIKSIKADLIPIGQTIMNLVIPIGSVVSKMLEGFNSLPDFLSSSVIIAAALAAAVGPITMLIGLFKNFTGQLQIFKQMVSSQMNFGHGVAKELGTVDKMLIANEKMAKFAEESSRQSVNNTRLFAEAIATLNESLVKTKILSEGISEATARTAAALSRTNPALAKHMINNPKDVSLITRAAMVGKGEEASVLAAAETNFAVVMNEKGKRYAVAMDRLTGSVLQVATLNKENEAILLNASAKEKWANSQSNKALLENAIIREANSEAITANTLAENINTAVTAPGSKPAGVLKKGKNLLGSRPALGGAGVLAAGGLSFLPSGGPGGSLDYASAIGQGAGLGLMFGPWGAAIGAGAGALIVGYQKLTAALERDLEKIRLANEKIVNSFKTASSAADILNVKLKQTGEINFAGTISGVKSLTEQVKTLKDAILAEPDTGTEKLFVEQLKKITDPKVLQDLANREFTRMMSIKIPKGKAIDLIQAEFDLAGKSIYTIDIIAKINSLKLDPESARKSLLDISGLKELHLENLSPYPHAGRLGGHGLTPKKLVENKTAYREFASAMSIMPANASLKEVLSLDKHIRDDLNPDILKTISYMKELGTEAALDTAANLEFLNKNGINNTTTAFELLSAQQRGVLVNFEELKAHQNDRNYVANMFLQAQEQYDLYKSMSKPAEEAAKAIQKQNEDTTKSMEDGFAAQQDAMQKNIDLTKEKYDKEIAAIQKAEDARKKAFDTEQKRISRSNEIRNMQIDYQKAIATGDYFGALTVQSNIAAKHSTFGLQDKDEKASERAKTRQEALAEKRDSVVKQMQDRMEATKKANDEAIKGARDRSQAEIDASKSSTSSIGKDQEWLKNEYTKAWTESGGNVIRMLQIMEQDAKASGHNIGTNITSALHTIFGNSQVGGELANGISQNINKFPWETVSQLLKARLSKDTNKVKVLENEIRIWSNNPNTKRAPSFVWKDPYAHEFRANGGAIVGPGSATSDSIFARLSNGEYVVRQSSVAKYGTHAMERVNRGEAKIDGFAAGGLVQSVSEGITSSAILSLVDLVAKETVKNLARSGSLPGNKNTPVTLLQQGYNVPDGSNSPWGYPSSVQGWGTYPGHGFARDYHDPMGTPIFSVGPGLVSNMNDGVSDNGDHSSNSPSNWVQIWHKKNGRKYTSYYQHLKQNSVRVRPKDIVSHATQIANSGNSGHSTGPHLHFEVRDGWQTERYTGPWNDKIQQVWNMAKGGIAAPQLKKGATVQYDNTLANLHAGETVLTRPLSDRLSKGINHMGGEGTVYNINLRVGRASATIKEMELALVDAIDKREARTGRKNW